MSTQVEPVLTINDLDVLPEDGNRYEIIEGELFVSRAPGLVHQRVSGNLFAIFRSHLDQNPIGEIIATPGVIFSNFDGVIPDLVFISRERKETITHEDRIVGAPELVVEILSPGVENEKRDRIVKRQLYGAYGVKEYWVVAPDKSSIDVYVLEDHVLKHDAKYTDEGKLVSSTVLSELVCKFEDIFRV